MPDQKDFPVPLQFRAGLDIRFQEVPSGLGGDLCDFADEVFGWIRVVQA